MLSFYHMIEITLYSVLNLLPYILLALYPFRDTLRFPKSVTIVMVVSLTVLNIGCGFVASLLPASQKGILSILSTAIYFLFYFVAIKAHFGKILFTMLILSNIANLVVVIAKCLEGIAVPELAIQTYRWSYSIFIFIIELILLIPLSFYIYHIFTNAVQKDSVSSVWLYLWAIPATFYLVWSYHLYCNEQSALEIAMQPAHALFLLLINIGAFLIYHIVVCLINEYDKTSFLEKQNHQLALQKLQYENLTNKISEVQRTKHDLHHHITIMSSYLNDGKLQELKSYLSSYQDSLPDNSPIVYCQNYNINLILLYFAQQAKSNNIMFSVHVHIPSKLNITEIDISVLLGNLLENAIEACAASQTENKKYIIVRGQFKDNSLFITIDNTFDCKIKQDKNGTYLSTKRNGIGLGIESAKQITMRYDGVFQVTQKENIFCVSVMLCLK